MKVLFLTYYWPPAGGVSAQRIIHFVRNLSLLGVDCHVIHPKGAAYYQVDDSLSGLLPQEINLHPVEIRDITRLVKSVPKMGVEGNIKSKSGGALSKLSKWLRANLFIPDPKANWVKPVVKKATELCEDNEFDVVFTNGTPHSVHLSGLAIKQSFQIPWIADFRDPWTKIDYFESMPLTASSIKKHKLLEAKVVKEADICLTVSPSWKDDFLKLGAKQAECITNGYDQVINSINEKDFLISHVGSLHGDRSLHDLLFAFQMLMNEEPQGQAKCKLVLVGNVSKQTIQEVKEKIPADRIILPGIVKHEEAKNWIGRSAVLLLPINKSKDAKGRIPAKLFEYLSSYKPIIVLGSSDGDAAKIVEDTQAGKCFTTGNSKDLYEYLSSIRLERLQAIDTKNTGDVAVYSRENTANQLLVLMKSLI